MENELIELLEDFIDFLRLRDEEEVEEVLEEEVLEEEFAEDSEQEEIAFSEMLGDIATGG